MLSLIIICKKINDSLIKTISSVSELDPQILVNISVNESEALGRRKNRLIQDSAQEWVLLLDSDEIASKSLLKEIKEAIPPVNEEIHGFLIPYQNYIFGAPARYGGEKYAKVRLFRKKYASVSELPIHEEVEINGKVKKLKGVIHHYSYVSLPQVLKKFTGYAWQMAGEKKKAHEAVTLKKLFMYGPHMVWARAIKDEGWRDGWRGVVIALCFGYMESLTYWLLLWRNIAG